MKESKAKRTLNWKEITWYVISGLLAIWGLLYIIFGLVIQFFPGSSDDLFLNAWEEGFKATFGGLNFMSWGFILFVIGLVVGVIVLCVYATTYDRQVEKRTRRAQRMIGVNHEKEETVVEAKVETPEIAAPEVETEEVKFETPTEVTKPAEEPSEVKVEETKVEETKTEEVKPEEETK